MYKIKIGMIHGRFQPFHLGHFEYLKEALSMSQKLIVGITNPDPNLTAADTTDSHRHLFEANPFPYYLRMRMILSSILFDAEMKKRYEDITVVPFPVNNIEMWEHYIPPKKIIQIMNIIDPWDNKKKENFERNGFRVHDIDKKRLTVNNIKVSGFFIRQQINEKSSWEHFVPPGTMHVLEKWFTGDIENLF